VRKTVAFIDSTMTGVWNGTAVGLAYGGTGATTQAGAANAVLPSQTSNSGKVLTTDGSNVSWASAGLAITDDTSTSATRYVTFTSATSGSATVLNTSSSRLTFNPGTGDLFVWGNVQANSDRRLKTNIVKIADAGAKVRLLNGVEFDWIESGCHSQGLIAQDVEVVAPDLVVESNGFKSVAYSNLVGLLVEAVKELQDEVANLKKQLGV
jgi:hypothetical protein